MRSQVRLFLLEHHAWVRAVSQAAPESVSQVATGAQLRNAAKGTNQRRFSPKESPACHLEGDTLQIKFEYLELSFVFTRNKMMLSQMG